MRTIYSPAPPPLHPGESILGSADIEDLMTQWVVAEAGDAGAVADYCDAQLPDNETCSPPAAPRNHAPRVRTRRRHDGRLRKACPERHEGVRR